jgi:hypothetical protein
MRSTLRLHRGNDAVGIAPRWIRQIACVDEQRFARTENSFDGDTMSTDCRPRCR